MLDALPGLWRAALEEIADGRPGAWRCVAFLPGGARVVVALEGIGLVERLATHGQDVTLTPFGAALLQVGLFEWTDAGVPCWLPLARIRVLQQGDRDAGTLPRPLKSPGEPGMTYRSSFDLDRRPGQRIRQWDPEDRCWVWQWDAQGGPAREPAPVRTEFDVLVGIGLDGGGGSALAFREADLRRHRAAEARRRRDAEKARKHAKQRRHAG